MPSILKIAGLSKRYDGVIAIDKLDLSFEEAQVTGLIGPNGAGKTTLFNIITGFTTPDTGSVLFRGHGVTGIAPWRVARLGITRTFQDLRVLRQMTVLDNVLLGFQYQRAERPLGTLASWFSSGEQRHSAEKARELLDFVGLADRANDLVQALSYGQQKLVALGTCLATEAELLLLDEPVAGIEPQTVKHILSLFRRLREDGKTIVLIEHNLEAVMQVSDQLVVLAEGRKVACGKPENVIRLQAVLEAYLS